MTPVDQRLIDPGVGDCLTCCVAAILDLPYEAVPRFNLLARESGGRRSWFHYLYDFLEPRGLDIWSMTAEQYHQPWDREAERPRYAVACGKSPRGTHRHATVWEHGRGIVHDPHPSRLGLDGPPTDFMLLTPRRSA